jgi:hypothetical protein
MRPLNSAALVLLGTLLVVLLRPALGAEAERPRTLLDTTYVPPTGRTLAVPAGGDFQAALDAAQPGDVITLEAGATFTGSFVLPKKAGTGWIIVRTSAPDSSLPPPGTRVDPSYATVMPKLVAPPGVIAGIITAPGAHHFRFIGIEAKPLADAFVDNLIVLSVLQPSEEMPHDLVFDRCYIHGDPVVGGRRGIVLNSSASAIIDSYLADFKQVGADSEAIMGWNGPGPFKIVNNYLEAASTNLVFGGADPTIQDLVPSDIEVRHNHFTRPLSWRIDDPSYAGTPWMVKNLLTLKNARRVLIDGNLFERNWLHEQQGTAVIFTVRNQGGTAPWSTVEDVTFSNNIVRHAGSAIGMHGWDDLFPSQLTKRILIRNNFFDDISSARWGGAGRLFEAHKGIEDLVIDHNTGLQDGAILRAEGGGTAAVSTTPGAQATFTFTGTSVSWVGFRGPQTGIARVSLDGAFVAEVDTFSTTEEVQAVIFTATNLSDASHVLTIEAPALKNPGSTNTFVVVDAFDVTSSSPAPTGTRFQDTDPSVAYTAGWVQGNTGRPWSPTHTRFVFRNNVTLHGDSGVIGSGTDVGLNTLATYFRGYLFERNILVGGNESLYPPNNFFPTSIADVGFVDPPNGNYRLASTSPYKSGGTDGKDIGADIDAIEAAMATRFEDTSPSATYTAGWIQDSTSRAWSGSTAAISATAGVRATFAFTGTSVSWVGFRGPQTGIARVFLDGAFVAEVDTFSTTEEVRNVVFKATGLADAGHALTLEVTGLKNAASTNVFIVVDAFDVPAPTVTRFQETDPSMTYAVGWNQGGTSRAWSGGTTAFSTTAGARATLTFTGTSVSWIGLRGPQTGIARVFLDGAFVAEVDTFSATEEVQAALFTVGGLADANHTLTIEVTGLKNAASTDTFIVVDAFDVTP